MTRALVRKELGEHGLALLATIPFGAGMALIARAAHAGEPLAAIQALRDTVVYLAFFAVPFVGYRLITREYRGQGQLFLETLPVTRSGVLTVKLALGAAWTAVLAGAGVGALMPGSSVELMVAPGVLPAVAARSGAFLACAFAYFSLLGLLGRYRVAFLGLTFMLAFMVDELTELSLDEWGPFGLLRSDAFQEPAVSRPHLLATLATAALMIAATYGLALGREGSVQALLGERMSRREKVFVVMSFFVALMAVYVVDERKPKPPYDLPDSEPVSGEGVTVKVGRQEDDGHDDGSTDVAIALHRALVRLADYLALEELPALYVVPRADLDAGHFSRAKLSEAEGVLVRANLAPEVFRERAFLGWAARELLVARSRGRVLLERNLWVLDGFSLQWLDEGRDDAERRRLELRALHGAPEPLREEHLREWLSLREALGPEIASAVAWSGLEALRAAAGELALRDLLRAVLAREFPHDARSVWREWRRPLEVEMLEHAGVSTGELVARWNATLASWRKLRGAELAALPRLVPEVEIAGGEGQERRLRYRVEIRPVPPPGSRVELLHVELGAFDEEIDPEKVARESHATDEAAAWQVLPLPLVTGSRLACSFELEVPELGCRVTSGWRRMEVE